MFTGIVQNLLEVCHLKKEKGLTTLALTFPEELQEGLKEGDSVAIDGVCLTVIRRQGDQVYFEAMEETLRKSTLANLEEGQKVNVERAARFGDEIGGHLVSGHIMGKVAICAVEKPENNHIVTLNCPGQWMKFIFHKGYVALDGVSLTVGEVDKKGQFKVHLIPETLRRTTFGFKRAGDFVNLEIDAQTQAVVETVERYMEERGIVR